MNSDAADWTQFLAETIQAACVWEATARKPGNVHPEASFTDVRYEDFVRSAELIAPVLAETEQLGVGRAIREAVAVTRRGIGRNTNLGIILLIAPLAAVPSSLTLRKGIDAVLAGLTVEDARHCYAAIRDASPGGLGQTSTEDVSQAPSVTLREAMQLAAERDRIAAQYANGFHDILERGLNLLATLADVAPGNEWECAVISLHLHLMSELPDTLIARKCGWAAAAESAERAQQVIDSGWPATLEGQREFQQLDFWLRADGNRRNPGTTADFVAAILFAALREHRLNLPATA